ncbi:MAG: class I SAM-dependent RNA methyltransferase [Eubacteriaceae bacterium]|nr:class I SAM-dependent RNA methyltransferase [Eubacteriaceae bacterium]
MNSNDMLVISATCAFGLESILKSEIISLGYEITASGDGFASIHGGVYDAYKLNIWLRTANRVLIEVAEGATEDFDSLFDLARKTPWKDFLPSDAKFNVSRISLGKSAIHSKSDSQRIIKKAMVDSLKEGYNIASLDESGPEYNIIVHIVKDYCKLAIDTSHSSLHKRGYRLQAGQAPLKETLAAGIVSLSKFSGNCEFVDFMCGSGTIAIEAALAAKGMAPGANRRFAIDNWGILSSSQKADALESDVKKKLEYRILASDIDPRMVKLARENAARAGVEDDIMFQKLDFRDFKSRKKYGIVATNPPYGERISDGTSLRELYTKMGNVCSGLDGWSFFVLCSNPEFANCFSAKKPDRTRKLFNGDMACALYQYYGAPIKARKRS